MPIKVNVRVIAATNQDLARAVKESRFREDLFHRLNVIRINTPPLRQRRDDIPLLLSHYLAQGGNRDNEVLFEFLWRDLDLQPKPIDTLPLTRYFGSPFGWMVARTGWDDQSVIAQMNINEYNFSNHQHADAGAFQIYYRGPLAIDSGVYSGSSGRYGSLHCRNYY